MLSCPFCGAPETDRITLEGARFLVFGCMFTPRVDPTLSDEEIADRLRSAASPGAAPFFRSTCDALHVYVTKGEGARFLTGASPEERTTSPDSAESPG